MYNIYTPAQMFTMGRINEISKAGQNVVDLTNKIDDIARLDYKNLKRDYFNLIFTEKVFDECKQEALDRAKLERDQAIKDVEGKLANINMPIT